MSNLILRVFFCPASLTFCMLAGFDITAQFRGCDMPVKVNKKYIKIFILYQKNYVYQVLQKNSTSVILIHIISWLKLSNATINTFLRSWENGDCSKHILRKLQRIFGIAHWPMFDLGHGLLSVSSIGFQTIIPEWNQLGSWYLAYWCILPWSDLGLFTDFSDLY